MSRVTNKRFQMVFLVMVGMVYQAPALAAPFDVFWQKCRASNTQAALDACDRAHDLRPLDATVQKRGDDLFLMLEKQKKTGVPAPQPQRPSPQPVQPRRPTPDPFDAHWKKCQASNTQAALNSCKQALNLRRNNATVRKRVNDLTQSLKPAPVRRVDPFDAQWRLCIARNTQSALTACTAALKLRPSNQTVRVRRDQLSKLLNPPPQPQRSPVVVQQRQSEVLQQPEQTPTLIADKTKVDKTIISRNQKILTQLGFDTGGTKGTIGKKTRKAVEDFNQVSGEDISSKLNDDDLVKLEAVLERHEEAIGQYEIAKKEREAGDLSLALNTVEEAIQVAPWNYSLHSLEEELKEQEKQKADEIILELDEDFKELESLD